MSSTSARRRTSRARRPLQPPSDRAAASTSSRRRSGRGPAARTFLPDEIWEEIFLLVDAAGDLVRASAACTTFRRIVSERRFLRRFRSLRFPAVLGLISREPRFFPFEPPHRSAPEARGLEQAADFTFSFLPEPGGWCFRHALDGRVLLGRRISTETRFEDFLVCDPLHRRYVEIPRIPNIPYDLLEVSIMHERHMVPVLAPAAENDEEGSFRVVCAVQLEENFMAFVFSSCNHTWRGVIVDTICMPMDFVEYMTYSAHGCYYWMIDCIGYSIMFDPSEMKFSTIELPWTHNFFWMRAIFEAEEGRLGFFAIRDGSLDLYYCKNWQRDGVAAQDWQRDKRIPLPKDYVINYHWKIEGTAGRYLTLGAYHGICDDGILDDELPPDSVHFVLDIRTLMLEKICTSNNGVFHGCAYARFPPLLALPSI